MNFLRQVRLTILAINILITSHVQTMEDKVDFAIKQRYEELRIAATKLSDPKICRENKDSILQSLEPEEKMLIDLAVVLARDHSRPVGRLTEFMIIEDRLKEKIKKNLKDYVEKREPSKLHGLPKENPEFLIMPWERIAPVNLR
jgi:hypothetical protein